MEENDFTIDVLDNDPERLGSSVNSVVPLEVGCDRQVDTKEGTSDWLDMCLQATEFVSSALQYTGAPYSSLGNWCTRRCTSLPAFCRPMSSPSSGGLRSK